MEGRFIAKKYEISKHEREEHGTLHYGERQACTARQRRKRHFLITLYRTSTDLVFDLEHSSEAFQARMKLGFLACS